MDFLLLALVTATLLVRPAEVIESLATVPVYQILILANLAVSFPKILDQLQGPRLRDQPITICVLGMLAATVMSHLAQGDLWSARFNGIDFFKTVLFYLLVVGVVNTPERFERFLKVVLACIFALAALAILQYHKIIDVPSLSVLEEVAGIDPFTGQFIYIPRLRSTGIFNDPNDLSLIVVVGIAIAAYWVKGVNSGVMRLAALGSIGMFGYSFALTKSRGGLVALLAALLAMFQARYGWKKAAVLMCLAVPVLFLALGARQTSIGTSEGTSQERIQYWNMAIQLMLQSPKSIAFGIGNGNLREAIEHVAHNSYVQSYAELGVFGGTIFFAAFFFSCLSLYKLGKADQLDNFMDDPFVRMRPYVLAVAAGYAAGMLSLSRGDVVPTYLTLGLAAAYLNLSGAVYRIPGLQFNSRWVLRMGVASFCWLSTLYLFSRFFARWG